MRTLGELQKMRHRILRCACVPCLKQYVEIFTIHCVCVLGNNFKDRTTRMKHVPRDAMLETVGSFLESLVDLCTPPLPQYSRRVLLTEPSHRHVQVRQNQEMLSVTCYASHWSRISPYTRQSLVWRSIAQVDGEKVALQTSFPLWRTKFQ